MKAQYYLFRLRYLLLCFLLMLICLGLEGYKQQLILRTYEQIKTIDQLKEQWSLLNVKKEKIANLKSLSKWAEQRNISQRDLERIIIFAE